MRWCLLYKDEAQGKKQLLEFIEGLEKDNDVKQVVAEWFQSKPNLKFDNSSIPDEFKNNIIKIMLVPLPQERPHLSGSFHLYLRKTVHTRGQKIDKIYIRNSRKIYEFS